MRILNSIRQIFSKSQQKDSEEALKNNEKYFDVNFLEYHPKITTKDPLPSSFLLMKTFDHMDLQNNIAEDIRKIHQHQGINTTLWSIKNQHGTFSVEYYFYYPKQYSQNSVEHLKNLFYTYIDQDKIDKIEWRETDYIISINPLAQRIEGINIYTIDFDTNSPVIEMKDAKTRINMDNPKARSFFYDFQSKDMFFKNLYYGYNDAKNQEQELVHQILETSKRLYKNENQDLALEYLKLPYIGDNSFLLSIAVKDDRYIGLYFTALDLRSFLTFLHYHQYPHEYIMEIENKTKKLNHLQFDVGIDFYLKDNQFCIKKTAFFGSI